MAKKKWVEKKHYRVTTEDGRRSYLYKAEGPLTLDTCVEIAENYEDGTTDAYEVDRSLNGQLFCGGKGKKSS